MRRDELLEQRDEIKAIAARHGAVNVRVFGSVARDEARPDSDVDFLVAVTKHTSSWFPAKLELDLEEALQTRVHVLTEGSFRPDNLRRVLRKAITL